MSTTSSTSTQFFQDFLGQHFNSRKLLLHNPLHQLPEKGTAAAPLSSTGDNTFNGNILMVLLVLLCGIFCSLSLHYIIRCALRCSSSLVVSHESSASNNPSASLANTGVKQKALKTFTIVRYSTEMNLQGLDTECAICLSEFSPGERLRLLPKCNHGFHVRCIDKWLKSHSSCPKCRHCLIQTCQKIVECSIQGNSAPEESVVRINIVPLQPEGMISNYREQAT